MSGIQLGLAGNVSVCCDMGLVGKYPKYVPKYSKYVTDGRHNVIRVSDEVIFCTLDLCFFFLSKLPHTPDFRYSSGFS